MLPIHLFKPEKLYTLTLVAGKPLKLDTATTSGKYLVRPSEARVCVEMDVLKTIPERVWIGSNERGSWQKIEIEEQPTYCTKCKKLGHRVEECQPQIKTQTKPMKAVATTQKKAPNEWQVVRSRKLQIKEGGGGQGGELSLGEPEGKEIDKAKTDKGKGVVPGSCPEIRRDEESENQGFGQGENNNLRTRLGKEKEAPGSSRLNCNVVPQTHDGDCQDANRPNQNSEISTEDNSELTLTEEGNQYKGEWHNLIQEGVMKENSKGEEEVKEHCRDLLILPLTAYANEEKAQVTEGEILPLVVYEKEQVQLGKWPLEEHIADQNTDTVEEHRPNQNAEGETQSKKKDPLLHKVDSGSKLKELLTDSEGETLLTDEQQFTRLAEGKEGPVDTRLKTLTHGKKYSATGNKS